MRIDSRKGVDAKSPRRKSQDLSFLVSDDSDQNDYLYESQISVLVSALEKETYVAYCCIDDYYNANGDRADIGEMEDGDLGNEDNNVFGTLDPYDPLTRFEQVTGSGLVDARKYFLLITSIQVKFVCNEWENSLVFLQRQIKGHVSQFFLFNELYVLSRWLRNILALARGQNLLKNTPTH